MGVLSVYHPDIEEFLEAKASDPKRLCHFNLSVMVDDAFMDAAERGDNITLHWPVYNDVGYIEHDESKWKVRKTVNAKELWEKIIRKAYDNGEPGVLFYDAMNELNPLYYTERIRCTNPCFTGDMRLLTNEGYKPFRELEGNDVEVVAANGRVTHGKVWKSGHKEVVRVKLSNGKEIRCTPDHVFMLNDGNECCAKDLVGKRVTPFMNFQYDLDPTFIKLGFIQGDGILSSIINKQYMDKCIVVNVGEKDQCIRELFSQDVRRASNGRTITVYGFNNYINSLKFSTKVLPERVFPETYNNWSIKEKRSFLHGCYSANGSVIKRGRVSYKTTCLEFAHQLVETLENDFSISSYITTNKPSRISFKNGDYTCKTSYDVNIANIDGLLKFAEQIGFYHEYKMTDLFDMIRNRAPYVTSVTPCGTEDVYDFTEPETHWGVVEGVVVHNCAEYLSGTVYGQELPSSAYGGACNLGSLMIHNFVVDPFGDNAHIDWERLTDVIFTAVRMLDNIIDKNQFPHEIYENYQKTFRTIGLGVTGLADALCMLGLRYNSAEARDFTDRLMNYIAHEAYAASMLLAEEKGTFPGYKKEYLSNEFLMSHVGGKYRWDDLCAAIKEHGIRNAKLLAVAPTGTMSIVFGNNCSSGIEPIFSLGYDRKVKIGAQTDDAEQTVTVEDYAYHLYKEMGIEGKDDVFRTALNISVEDHLAMLGTIARHVDMSVSKTINIPTEYSFEDTKEVYEKAWKLGIKGCTIFRPNALRPGIFNTSKKEDEHYNTADEIPRGMIEDVPQNLTYQKHKIKTGCGSLYLFVGVDENDGKIYDFFTNTDGVGGCTVSTQANSRLMSAALRGGVPVEYIIEQLQKSGSCPSYQYARGKGKEVSKGKSCPSAIAYVLQSVVDSLKTDDDCDDGFYETTEKVVISAEGGACPECGEKEVVHEGGCLTCRNCGWSKCS